MKNLVILALFISLVFSSCVNDITPLDTLGDDPITENTKQDVPEVDSINVAQITFTKTSHDFGKIKEGEVVEHTFTFKNTGKMPLSIENVKVSCGCTAADYPKEPVAPNAEGKIKLRFDSKGKVGKQNKPATIIANTWPTSTPIYFEGIVEKS